MSEVALVDNESGRSILLREDRQRRSSNITAPLYLSLSTTGAGSLPLGTSVQPVPLITGTLLAASLDRKAAGLTAGPIPFSACASGVGGAKAQ